jgi:uncharacterized membrane protein YecN with MAPEG domain
MCDISSLYLSCLEVFETWGVDMLETWCLTLREEHEMGVLENTMHRRIFGIMRTFMIFTFIQILQIDQSQTMGWWGI